jgi:hypothetical protein
MSYAYRTVRKAHPGFYITLRRDMGRFFLQQVNIHVLHSLDNEVSFSCWTLLHFNTTQRESGVFL